MLRSTATPDRADQGFTVVEFTVAMMLLVLVMATFVATYSGFLRDTAFANRLAELERETRPSFNQLVIELRQALPPDGDHPDQLIELLRAHELIFTTDRRDAEGPERYRYVRDNCTGTVCQLRLEITNAVAGSGPDWTYPALPELSQVVIERMDANHDVFVGRRAAASGIVDVASCDLGTTSAPCDLVAIRIDFRAVPEHRNPGPDDYVIAEEVRLRNVVL